MDTNEERQRFEEWAKTKGFASDIWKFVDPCDRNKISPDCYYFGDVQLAWQAWQARASQDPRPASGAEEQCLRRLSSFIAGYNIEGLKEENLALGIAVSQLLDENDNHEAIAAIRDYAAHVTAAKDAEIAQITRNRDECAKVFEIDRNHELTGPHAECACPSCNLRREIERLKRVLAHIQKWGHGSYACHISPDKDALERNKSVEVAGERIREELVDFLKRNQIVGMMLDTEEHVVRVDIAKLPPNIKPVLTLWGSIYVKDEPEASHEQS